MENETFEQQPDQKPVAKFKGAARETLYRVVIRNQLNSIGIADQKANIIIGINTIIISIIITILGFESTLSSLQFIAELDLNIPLSVLLVTCLISGIIAIYVVRPVAALWRKESQSKLFFRNYNSSDMDEFKKEMNEMLTKSASIYDSLNTDMYLFGKAVHRKYRLLRYAYHIFLIGMLLTVSTFFLFYYFF